MGKTKEILNMEHMETMDKLHTVDNKVRYIRSHIREILDRILYYEETPDPKDILEVMDSALKELQRDL